MTSARSESTRTGPFLPSRVIRREQTHRRTIVLAIATLIVFSTLPVFGHHLAGRADALLVGRDHLGALCLVALHMLLAPVHGGFHLLLLTGLAYAIHGRMHSTLRLRQVLQLFPGQVPDASGAFGIAARRAGLPHARLRILRGMPVPAFTVGFFRPVVYLDSALQYRMSADELAAVLAHEAAHVARRDPLRLSMLRFLAQLLFWVPALRRIADDAADEMEVRADDYAAAAAAKFAGGGNAQRGSLVLASAILSLANAHTQYGPGAWNAHMIGAIGFHRQDLLERRVRRLAGEEVAFGTHLTRRSIVGATAALAAVWISGLMMAHPLPPASSAVEHCEHHHASVLMHLFCRGEIANKPCAHTGV